MFQQQTANNTEMDRTPSFDVRCTFECRDSDIHLWFRRCSKKKKLHCGFILTDFFEQHRAYCTCNNSFTWYNWTWVSTLRAPFYPSSLS